jgi:hypothetical protein
MIENWWTILTNLNIWAGVACLWMFTQLHGCWGGMDEDRVGRSSHLTFERCCLGVLTLGLILFVRGCIELM